MQERSLSSSLPQNILYFKDEHENSICPSSTSGLKQQAVKQGSSDAEMLEVEVAKLAF